MEAVKAELIAFFEDTLPRLKDFKKKTYEPLFHELFDVYEPLFNNIGQMCRDAGEAQEAITEELASVIPDYVSEKMQDVPKRKKEHFSMDYNMNMAVYVVPLMMHPVDKECQEVAKKMVKLWNQKKATSLELKLSTYETISSGFKKGLCYITTAVCEYQNKPDDCHELSVLRSYRDQYLLQTESGRELVEEYYNVAPAIVMAIAMQPDSEQVYDTLYKEYLEPCVRDAETGRYAACEERYISMVRGLQKQYFHA